MKLLFLPANGINIDACNPPDNLETIVKANFAKFTSETNPEYVDDDKLLYIDKIRRSLLNKTPEDVVMDIVMIRARYEFEEMGKFPDASEFYDKDFMEEMFECGFACGDFYKNEQYNPDGDKKIHQTMVRIIKTVMNWEKDQ